MSESSSADAAVPGALPARRAVGSALALRNWPVVTRLIALVALPAVLGLALAGLWVANATRSAAAYGQIDRIGVLGQQVNGLAQAMEGERAETAAFIAEGRPAAGLAALHRQYVITNGWAAGARRLILRLGPGYPVQTKASAARVLAGIAELPGLRAHATQSRPPALTVINGYSAAIAGLFPVTDGIAGLSGDSALITTVRTLGSLSRMKDQASLQEAVLGAALAEGRFGPGALATLTAAEAEQASDLVLFRGSATREQSWALTGTLASPLAGQARAVERRAEAAGNGPLALGGRSSQQWQAGMSYTVGWMRTAERQLAGWITAYAQAQQRSAIRSAMAAGGVALAALLLVVLATMIIARSIVRPLRRLEAAALDVAETRLPAEVALGAAGGSLDQLPVTPIDVQSTDEIGQVARAVDRVHREAIRLTGEEARQCDSVSAIFVSFLRRSSSLLEPMLRLIDSLELGEDDPERLAVLFQMDHLATRMRRNTDSALVLAGHQTPRRWTEPVTLVDVLRAALSEIEQYDRVVLDVEPAVSITASAAVNASAAVDIVHLLAELLENATTFSPSTAQVTVSGRTARGGDWLISITDAGTGMPEEQLRQLNWQLAHPPLADAEVARRMGLFAVGHLAARHGINVVMRQPPGGGTTAEVHIPAALISHDARPGGWPGQAGQVLWAAGGGGADAAAGPADQWSSPPRFADGPDLVEEPESARPDLVPTPLGAPLPAEAPAAPATVIVPDSVGAEPDGLPIFDSVASGYFDADREGLTSAGLPQRTPQATLVPGGGADGPTRPPVGVGPAQPVADADCPHTATESAQMAQTRLASFQRGSRRARLAAQMDRDAKPARDD
jgi:signal transduction histidine kinase